VLSEACPAPAPGSASINELAVQGGAPSRLALNPLSLFTDVGSGWKAYREVRP
jgi:hypothetical protein